MGLYDELNKVINEAIVQDPIIEISDKLDSLGFVETNVPGIIKFVKNKNTNYTHIITLFLYTDEIIWEVIKDTKTISKRTYRYITLQNIYLVLEQIDRME